MNWEFLITMVLAIPFVAFPVFLWYMDIGTRYIAIRDASKRTTTRGKEKDVVPAGLRDIYGEGINKGS